MMAVLQANQGSKRVELARASGATLPFPDGSYDAVITVHVFHLIPAWQQALREVQRVLKPGGVLLNAYNGGTSLHSLRYEAMGDIDPPVAGVHWRDFNTFLTGEGWQRTRRFTTFFDMEVAPITILHALRERLWSSTWFMSDAEIEETSGRLEEILHERYDDPQKSVIFDSNFNVEVFWPPRSS
jgi:SAM-dependent methyltransferase